MPFLTRLAVHEHVENGRDRWILFAPLEYHGHTDQFVVPVGFASDFASVPRLFWSMFPPFGRYTRAAVLHDYLYVDRPMVAYETNELGETLMGRITRKDADGVFLRAMKEAGVSWWRRQVMYRAVRAFGFTWWRRRWGSD